MATTGAGTTVPSRWWYWVLAYPISLLIVLPLLVVLAIVAVAPVVLLGASPAPGVGGVWIVIALFGGAIVLALVGGLVVIFAMLPVALYFDARAIAEAGIDWEPDPLVYALIAALQFVVTPAVGLVIALYYLYRRHVALGVP